MAAENPGGPAAKDTVGPVVLLGPAGEAEIDLAHEGLAFGADEKIDPQVHFPMGNIPACRRAVNPQATALESLFFFLGRAG